MKWIKYKEVFESSESKSKVQLLTTIEVDDLVSQVDKDVDDLYSNIITSIKDFVKKYSKDYPIDKDKSVWKFLINKPTLKNSKSSIHSWALSNLDKDNSRMSSDVVDIETFLSLDTELDSIKEGDEVLALMLASNDKVNNFPCVISFTVENIMAGRTMSWLGLGASDSYCPQLGRNWGMIDIKWCKLIVSKETYNSFASPDKRL